MKKSIKVVVQKIDEQKDGVFTGGFASIRGGFMAFATLTTTKNSSCTNTASSCSGYNGTCTNAASVDCSRTVNSIDCSNVAVCQISCLD